jgi:hypothetical protein
MHALATHATHCLHKHRHTSRFMFMQRTQLRTDSPARRNGQHNSAIGRSLCTTHTQSVIPAVSIYLTSPLNASCFWNQLYRTLPASQPCPLTSLPSHITSMASSLHHSLSYLPCLQDPTADSPCGGSSCDRGTVLAAHGSTAAAESSRRDNCRATHSSFNRPNCVCLWIVAIP